ncbi:MAG TPA: 30S ribosomal protein S21 [Candidatus Paceibacterota bacterium]
MVKITKKENESTGSLLRRFSRAVKLSTVLTRARGRRYYEPPKSEFQKKRDALRRIKLFKELDKQRKLGKILSK